MALCTTLAQAQPAVYTLNLDGASFPIRSDWERFCQRADKDGNHQLTDEELEAAFKLGGRLLTEFKYAMSDQRLPERSLYPDAGQVQARLEELARAHPDCAHLTSLGKSHEGRDLWALRLSTEPEGKRPGIVITGGTHAREWASVALPLQLAETLLRPESRERLQSSEIWIVPLVNPDGYEYSREHDNSYRKNRRPGDGVDLNRNYADGAHPELYRPRHDSLTSKEDDVGASDRPGAETYRGPAGASEPEVQAMLRLELEHRNIVAVLDNHAHGNWLLRPATSRSDDYDDLAERMNEAGGRIFKYRSADELYPMSGNSLELLQAHGIKTITLESGHSFQPPAAELQQLLQVGIPANLVFIDEARHLPFVGLGRPATPRRS